MAILGDKNADYGEAKAVMDECEDACCNINGASMVDNGTISTSKSMILLSFEPQSAR